MSAHWLHNFKNKALFANELKVSFIKMLPVLTTNISNYINVTYCPEWLEIGDEVSMSLLSPSTSLD